MGLHEKMKQAIIAEEIIGYLMEKRVTDMQISISIKEPDTTFVIVLDNPDTEVIEELKENLFCCRDQELEEYGWELFMDNQPEELLRTLGMLIDSYDLQVTSNQTILTLVRKH